jgi:nitrate/nitrite transporter NarK
MDLISVSAAGVFWTIPAKIFSAELAGGARGFINALGNLGGFCGPYAVGVLITMYSRDAGVYCLAVSLAVSAVLALLLPEDHEHTLGDSHQVKQQENSVEFVK